MPPFILDPVTWLLAVQEDPESSSRVRAGIISRLVGGRDLFFTLQEIWDLRDLAGLPTNRSDRPDRRAWSGTSLDDAGLARLEALLITIERIVVLSPPGTLRRIDSPTRLASNLDKIISSTRATLAAPGPSAWTARRREFMEKLDPPGVDWSAEAAVWSHPFRTELEILLIVAESNGLEFLTASEDTKLFALHAFRWANITPLAHADGAQSATWDNLMDALRAYADKLSGWGEQAPDNKIGAAEAHATIEIV